MKNNGSAGGCPNRDQLRQLLGGDLQGDVFVSLEAHIQTCDACQETLAVLSDGADTDEWRRALGGDGSTVGPTCDFLERVKRDAPQADDVIQFPGAPTDDAPLGRLASYDILRELGRGGMGVVFLARDAQLRHLVALKVLKPEMAGSSTDRERFFREGRAAAAVKSDHIVAIHGANSSAEFYLPYLVMEYVEGETLDQRLKRQGPLAPNEAARLAQQAARGLAAAHEKNLVHRDVKPSNLMFDSATQRVKITDFGLARRADLESEDVTRYGDIVGTPAYMSPEHITNPGKVDRLSDVYCLGVVLYELMTGERPFRGSRHMVLQQIVHEEPRSPRGLNDAIPRDLETICLKCLRKSPADRYPDAQAVADDLGRMLDGQPIQARPVSRREKLWLWCRRNPRIAVPTAASVLLFVLAFGVVSSSAWALSLLNGQLRTQTSIAEIAKKQAVQEAAIADQQRDLAELRAEMTLTTIKEVFTETKRTIGNTPGLQPLKQHLVRKAAESLKHLPQMTGRSGITTAATTLQYHRLMHEMYLEIGETEKAWTHITHAHEIAQQRVKDQDNSNNSRINLAQVCGDMSQIRLQHNRDMQAALTYAREAVAVYEDILAKPRPSLSTDLRLETTLELSEAHSAVATIFVREGDPAKALAHYEKAKLTRDSVLSDSSFPALRGAARMRNEAAVRDAQSLLAIGDMRFRLGQSEQARQVYDRAVAVWEEVFGRNPDNPAAKHQLALTLNQAGNLCMLTGDPQKAAEHLSRAIQLESELAAADAKIVDYRRFLGLAHFRRGILRQMQGDPLAKEDFDACLAIRSELAKDAANVSRRRELLLILPRCGKHQEADIVAEKLLAEVPEPDIELLLDLARAYAQCSVATADDPPAAEAYRAQALARLEQAVKAGHRDPVYLEHEPDFAPLRSRTDFRSLIEQERRIAGQRLAD